MNESTMIDKAIVLGGTGLIGHELLKLLMVDAQFQEVHLIGRRDTELASSKFRFNQVEMENLPNYAHLFNVNVVFCCLGTTMKTAGSKEAFRKVDHDMVIQSAMNADGKVNQFLIVSSLGANHQSSNFYLKIKGETEEDVMKTNIPSISILRPSILFGDRKEKRTGESIGISFMKTVQPILVGGLRKYRGNEARSVAMAMLKLAKENKPGKHIYESTRIDEISASAI